MSVTPRGTPAGAVGNATTTKVSAPQQPKVKGFLSFLCCGVPDHGDTVDSNETAVPANRVTKLPAGHPTTASISENARAGQQNNILAQPQTEKEALQQAEAGHDRDEVMGLQSSRTSPSGASQPAGAHRGSNRPIGTRDQPLPELPQEAGPDTSSANPSVVVQAPARRSSTRLAAAPEQVEGPRDGDDDAGMKDSSPLPSVNDAASGGIPRREEVALPVLPPPPPVPQAGPSDEPEPETAEAKQQWLLPPIAPRFKGKKCLVLDLDETLVHSSFKVWSFPLPAFYWLTIYADSTPGRLHNPSGDRRAVPQCLRDQATWCRSVHEAGG
jgi:RNA polymerase II subunit A small phosphatase-like protein